MTLAKKVTTKTQPIWPSRTLYAGLFADQISNPHATPVAADPEWNEMIDLLQDGTVGHIHDGTSGTKIPAASVVNTALVLTPSALQTVAPTLSTNPGVRFVSTNMTATNPIPLEAFDGSNNGIDFMPVGPAIIPFTTSTSTGFYVVLIEYYQTDNNKAWNMFTFDPLNTSGLGVNTVFIGDDGVSLVGLANGGTSVETATGNMKLLCAAGSTFDSTEFTGGEKHGPFQGTTKTKAGLPVAADIPAGNWAVYKDTTGGSIRLWANDGGVMKSVALV